MSAAAVVGVYLIFINAAAFFVCALDKHRAKRQQWRISEKTLFILALLGGAAGLYLSMLLIRHKTRHWAFMLGVPVIIAAQVVIALFLWAKFS